MLFTVASLVVETSAQHPTFACKNLPNTNQCLNKGYPAWFPLRGWEVDDCKKVQELGACGYEEAKRCCPSECVCSKLPRTPYSIDVKEDLRNQEVNKERDFVSDKFNRECYKKTEDECKSDDLISTCFWSTEHKSLSLNRFKRVKRVSRCLPRYDFKYPNCWTETILTAEEATMGVCQDVKGKLCPITEAREGTCKGTTCEIWHSNENPSYLTECSQTCLQKPEEEKTEDNISCLRACLTDKEWDVNKFTDVFVQMMWAMSDCDYAGKLMFPEVEREFTKLEFPEVDCKPLLKDLADHLTTIADSLPNHDKCIRPSSALFTAKYFQCRSGQEDADLVTELGFTPHNRENTKYVHEFILEFLYKKKLYKYVRETYSRDQFRDSRGLFCVPIKMALEKARIFFLDRTEDLSFWFPSEESLSIPELVWSLITPGAASSPQ